MLMGFVNSDLFNPLLVPSAEELEDSASFLVGHECHGGLLHGYGG